MAAHLIMICSCICKLPACARSPPAVLCRLHQSATKRCQQAQVSLRELEAAQRAAQHKLTAVQAALAEAAAAEAEDEAQEEAGQRRAGSGAAQREQEAAGAAGSESEGEGGDGADEEGHRQRRRLALRPSASSAAQTPAPPVPLAADADAAASSRQPSGKRAARPFKPGPRSKRPLVESSSEEEAEHPPAAARSAAAAGGSSCSNSDFEAALSSRRPSAAASKRSQGRQQRLGGGRGRGHAARAADAAADEGVAWGEAEVEAAVEELRQEEQELQVGIAGLGVQAAASHACGGGPSAGLPCRSAHQPPHCWVHFPCPGPACLHQRRGPGRGRCSRVQAGSRCAAAGPAGRVAAGAGRSAGQPAGGQAGAQHAAVAPVALLGLAISPGLPAALHYLVLAGRAVPAVPRRADLCQREAGRHLRAADGRAGRRVLQASLGRGSG